MGKLAASLFGRDGQTDEVSAVTRRQEWVPQSIDTSVPSMARAYDFLLGGAHNFAADREFAAQVEQSLPGSRQMARVNRAFMARAVRFMLDEGIRQFLDVGSGIPTVGNVHEIVHDAAPGCRVVYVDKDPIAVAHSELILEHNENAGVVGADMRDAERIFGAPQVRRLLDLSQPVGLLFLLVLHWIPDEADPYGLLERYLKAMPSGSFLAISHVTETSGREDIVEEMTGLVQRSRSSEELSYRDYDDVVRLFGGLELVHPGVVGCGLWRPGGPGDISEEPESNTVIYVGVGRKP
jgi:hypothetical protein